MVSATKKMMKRIIKFQWALKVTLSGIEIITLSKAVYL